MKEESRYNLEMYHVLLQMLKYMIVSLEKNITGKNKLKENGYGCKGLGKVDVEVKYFALYPNYAVSEAEKKGLSKWKLRCLYEDKMKQLKTGLAYDKSDKVDSDTLCFATMRGGSLWTPYGTCSRLWKYMCTYKG